jgi:hypothetical protein
VLQYTELMSQLDIPTVRELEDFLITECFYNNILKGKLDQKQRALQVRRRELWQGMLLQLTCCGYRSGCDWWGAMASSSMAIADAAHIHCDTLPHKATSGGPKHAAQRMNGVNA